MRLLRTIFAKNILLYSMMYIISYIIMFTLDKKWPLKSESSNSRARMAPDMTPIAAPLHKPDSVVCPFMAPAMLPIITPPAKLLFTLTNN